MKRIPVCVFSILAIILIVCTVLSMKIETAMTPHVYAVGSTDLFSPLLPLNTIHTDEQGTHLYLCVQGEGWEKGIHCSEVLPQDYLITEEGVRPSIGQQFVQFYTKPIRSGDVINVLKNQETRKDYWLILSPDSVTELPRDLLVEGSHNGASLVSVDNSPTPFMEDMAIDAISPATIDSVYADTKSRIRIYSLGEVSKMVSQFPKLGGVIGILLGITIIWAYCCFTSGKRAFRKMIWANAALCAFLLVSFALLVKSAELPSSLLPQDSIFDFGYYQTEFHEITEVIGSFSQSGSTVAQHFMQTMSTNSMLFWVTLLTGAALPAAIILLEHCSFCKTKRIVSSQGAK